MNELLERRDAAMARMKELAAKPAGERTDEERTEFDALEAQVQDIDRAIALHRDDERKAPAAPTGAVAAATGATAGAGEPGTPAPTPSVEVRERDLYGGENAQFSWFADVRKAKAGDQEARKRLEDNRRFEEQRNLVSTTDSDGGYFTAPAQLQDEFVELRRYLAVALGLVTVKPLPDGTQLIKLPKVSTGVAAALTTQGSALQDTDMVLGIAQAQVYRVGGKQVVSNFLLDRGMPGIDGIILRDLAGACYSQADTYLLHGTGSSQPKGMTKVAEDASNTVTADAATATISDVLPKVTKAVGMVAANAKRYPTGQLWHPRRVTWAQGQLDTEKRPILGAFGPVNAIGSTPTASAEGLRTTISGAPVHADGHMRVNRGTGTDEDDIIVGAFDEVYAFTGLLKAAVSDQAAFDTDDTVFRATMDFAVMADRNAGAIAVVQGTALNDVL